MQAVDLIHKKRNGESLSSAEIAWFIGQYTAGHIPDYQVAAWLMVARVLDEHGSSTR